MRNKIHQKQCGHCGQTFHTHRVRSKYCGHSCAALHKHATICQRGEKNPNYKGPLALSNYQHKKRWRSRHPEKAFAHDVFAAAIRAGKIKRGVCEVCGSERTDGHHDDYSKPLEVRWLCRKHHAKERDKNSNAPDVPCSHTATHLVGDGG